MPDNSGMPATPSPVEPTDITLHQASAALEIAFASGERFRIPFELLRVYSPSAEVQGHSPEQRVLQVGKRGVGVVCAEPVGHYALRLGFSDGHDSGLFTWTYLHQLGRDQTELWQRYEAELSAAGASRDPD
jgi:DUF971 family protein